LYRFTIYCTHHTKAAPSPLYLEMKPRRQAGFFFAISVGAAVAVAMVRAVFAAVSPVDARGRTAATQDFRAIPCIDFAKQTARRQSPSDIFRRVREKA
jgi:hypothetical protein